MAYTCIDRAIAWLRFRAAYRHIGRGSRVCDVGCGLETAFLEYAGDRIVAGIGVDEQVQDGIRGRWQTVHADIRTGLPLPAEQFDHVVMLAVPNIWQSRSAFFVRSTGSSRPAAR